MFDSLLSRKQFEPIVVDECYLKMLSENYGWNSPTDHVHRWHCKLYSVIGEQCVQQKPHKFLYPKQKFPKTHLLVKMIEKLFRKFSHKKDLNKNLWTGPIVDESVLQSKLWSTEEIMGKRAPQRKQSFQLAVKRDHLCWKTIFIFIFKCYHLL